MDGDMSVRISRVLGVACAGLVLSTAAAMRPVPEAPVHSLIGRVLSAGGVSEPETEGSASDDTDLPDDANSASSLGAAANGPVALTGVAPAVPTEALPSPSSAPDAESEDLALGIPNGPLSVRPAAEVSAEGASDGVFGGLDPRTKEIARIVGAMGVVLGLLVLLRVVLKRTTGLGGGGRPAGVLEVLARYPVARGQSLMLIKLARRVILVHQTSVGMSTLTEVTEPEEVAALLARMESGSRSSDAARFRSVLRSFEGEHDRIAGSADAVEIVDLTKTQSRGLASLLGRRRLSA